jgi:hypothetical protein
MRILKKKDLNELVGGDMNSDGGDKPYNGDHEIETGPVQKSYNDSSNYEKGEPPTSDKVFGRYVQNIPWFAVYSYGSRRAGVGALVAFEGKGKIMTKKTVEEKIEDLVKKTKDRELSDKDFNPKVEKIIDTIKDAELTEKQLEELKKALEDKKTSKNL